MTIEPHDERDDYSVSMSGPPSDDVAATTERLGPGMSLGRYVVVEELGEGGMGTVLLAYDAKLCREVALKRLRRDVLGELAEARLVREARTMARLSHPNVVAVYDVEVGRHGVVLAMEYVRGVTLRTWLSVRPHRWREIVEVFLQAAEGLAAAHRAGVVHRDFKPTNVLVSEDDRVKVADLGLAKPVGPDSADSDTSVGSASGGAHTGVDWDGLTRDGAVVGTPYYLAPDQFRGGPADARSDQYAFCLALWEALTGTRAFGKGRAMVDAKLAGAPPWPRRTRVKSVPRSLVAILERGLNVRPEQRFATMDAVIVAIRNVLKRRRRAALSVGALSGIGALAGLVHALPSAGSSAPCPDPQTELAGIWDADARDEVDQALRATDAPFSVDTAVRVRARIDDWTAAWTFARRDACEATRSRGSDHAGDAVMSCLHHALRDLEATVDVLRQADAELVARAVLVASELPQLGACNTASADDLARPLDPDVARAFEATEFELARARRLIDAAKFREAVAVARRLEPRIEGLHHPRLRIESDLVSGLAADGLGDYAASTAGFQAALDISLRHQLGPQAAVAATRLAFAVGYRRSLYDEGLAIGRIALDLAEAHDPDGPIDALARATYGAILFSKGRTAEAEDTQRQALRVAVRALGLDHPHVATAHNHLGNTLFAMGRYDAAEAEYRAAMALRKSTLGEDHPDVTSTRSNIANVSYARGHFEQAEREYRVVLANREEALGRRHPDVASAVSNLATALGAQGRTLEAEVELRTAVELYSAISGPMDPHTATARNNLGNVLWAAGKLTDAESELREALRIRLLRLGPDHRETANSHNNLANVLAQQGRLSEAEAEQRSALAVQTRVLPPDHPDLAGSLLNLGDLLREQGRMRDALPQLEKAWEIRSSIDIPPADKATAAWLLAQVLWTDRSARPRAKTLARTALSLYEQAEPTASEELANVRAWLARTGTR